MQKRLWLCPLLLMLSLCAAPAALAEEASASDALLAMQLRLSDLGYYTTSVTGCNDAASENALAAFYAQNGAEADVFAHDAKPSVYRYAAHTEQTMLFGMPMEWSVLEEQLTEGTAYTVTSRVSGVPFEITCLSGGAHAHVAPASEWDAETLVGQFGGLDHFRALPVVITVDDTRIAGSLSGHARTLSDGGTAYCLYVAGACSTFGGLPDAMHTLALD